MSSDAVSAASVAALLAVGAIAGVVVCTTPAAADEHTKADAADLTGKANYTVTLPERTDHYPGNHPVHSEHDGYNASIEYYAAGDEAFDELDAEEGAFLDVIIIEADFIDYSRCDAVQNTKSFGIDRDNNNSGTRTDEGLTQYRKRSDLSEGGLLIDFYAFEDISNDPPYMAPEDAIVAAQGVGSNDGPCLRMTSEPGWYQLQGFLNGTEADNGPDQEPSEDANTAGLIAYSNYIYICECDSEQEARQQLGPPPNEDGGGGGEETPTSTPTATPTVGEATPTPTPTPTPTADAERRTPTPTPTPNGEDGREQSGAAASKPTARGEPTPTGATRGDDARRTPTISQAPGFGPLAALLSLLVGALFVYRRR